MESSAIIGLLVLEFVPDTAAAIKRLCMLLRPGGIMAFQEPSWRIWLASANGLTGKSNGEIREALGNKFPKHFYHAIVCIGALVAHKEDDYWAVDAIGAPHVGDRSEKQLISAFVGKIAELNPELEKSHL